MLTVLYSLKWHYEVFRWMDKYVGKKKNQGSNLTGTKVEWSEVKDHQHCIIVYPQYAMCISWFVFCILL